ncbi:hypothetical protein GCM10023166_34230 [Paeniglutamicibacter cryotolerans]
MRAGGAHIHVGGSKLTAAAMAELGSGDYREPGGTYSWTAPVTVLSADEPRGPGYCPGARWPGETGPRPPGPGARLNTPDASEPPGATQGGSGQAGRRSCRISSPHR